MESDSSDPIGKPSSEDSREMWITIDRLCDAYEAALQEGPVDRAAFLAGVRTAWREHLREELDAIDAAYRDAQETHQETLKATPDEYCSRRLPSTGRLAELANLDARKVWLGRFEIHERLGSGATGSVWRARDARLARWVALKVPHATRLTSETTAARFQREARASAAINHPNVVQVHEVLIEDGLPILIQQWIDGPSLAKYLKTHGPLEFEQAAAWLSQIADAVACAHQRGIVHRDLKPANVMIANDHPMVLDFGLASYPESSSGLTSEDALLGTPAYMSPEQAEGGENADKPPTDVYALGTILYEMLVGATPFVGKTREVLDALKSTTPASPRSRRSGVPRDLETITMRCLAKSPTMRYRSAADLRDDLDRFLRREPIRARKVSPLETTWVWCRAHPVRSLLAVCIPLIVTMSMVVLASQRTQSRLSDRAERLSQQQFRSESERRELERQRNMIQLARASQELAYGDRTRGLELLANTPESMRSWEWRLLNLMSRSPSRTIHADSEKAPQKHAMVGLAMSRVSGQLFAGCEDGRIIRWKLPKHAEVDYRSEDFWITLSKPSVLYRVPSGIQQLTVSPDHRRLAWIDLHDDQRPGHLGIWDLVENDLLQRIELPPQRIGRTFGFSSDSQSLAIAGGRCPLDDDGDSVGSAWLQVYADAGDKRFQPVAERVWMDRAPVTSLVFTRSNQLALTRGDPNSVERTSGTVEVWKVEPGELAYQRNLWRGTSLRGLDYHRPTNRLAWCDAFGMVFIGDVGARRTIRQFMANRSGIEQVRFGPQGKHLCVVGGDGEVSLWAISNTAPDESASEESTNVTERTPQSSEETDTRDRVSLSNRSLRLSYARDFHGHESRVHDAIFLSVAPPEKMITRLHPFERFSQLISCGQNGRVIQWSHQSHPAIDTLSIRTRWVNDALWLNNRQVVLSTLGSRRWREPLIREFSLDQHGIAAFQFHAQHAGGLAKLRTRADRSLPDASRKPTAAESGYVACCSDRLIVVSDPRATAPDRVIENQLVDGAEFTAVASFAPGQLLAATRQRRPSPATPRSQQTAAVQPSFECEVVRIDIERAEVLDRIPCDGVDLINHLLVTPDNTIIAATEDGRVAACSKKLSSRPRQTANQASATKPRRQAPPTDFTVWQAHPRSITDLAWIPEGRRVVTASADGTCSIWRLPEPHQTGLIQVARTHELLVSGNPVTNMAVSSSGERLATAGSDRVIRIFDTTTALELVSLEKRTHEIASISFSPADRYLMIVERDGRVEVIALAD
jgi:serine/threonine protein kinase/WD40 repeat protein